MLRMRRQPRPSLATTTLPALATLLSACQHEGPRYAPNPPPPPDPPPQARDAGGPRSLEPTLINPQQIPPMPLGGAPVAVSPMPPPSPAPSPAPAPAPSSAPHAPMAPSAAPAPMAPAPMAPAPMAAAPAALPPGMYLMHNHPPGTPCRPVSQTELQQALQRAGR